jgi:hypothetical protein
MLQRASTSTNFPMTEQQLRARMPSVFAEQAWSRTSSKYTFIPTIEVVRALAEVGMSVADGRQARSRTEGKAGFARHLLRFRDFDQRPQVGKTHSEVVLINSHDGSSGYKLMGGRFRLVCSNGMIIPDEGPGSIAPVRARHQGDILDQVLEGTGKLIREMTEIDRLIERMMATDLDHKQMVLFAQEALALRFGLVKAAPIIPEALLAARRNEDDGRSVWQVLNRVQENLIRGGQSGRRENGRRFTVREITGIDGDVQLNQALWSNAARLVAVE